MSNPLRRLAAGCAGAAVLALGSAAPVAAQVAVPSMSTPPDASAALDAAQHRAARAADSAGSDADAAAQVPGPPDEADITPPQAATSIGPDEAPPPEVAIPELAPEDLSPAPAPSEFVSHALAPRVVLWAGARSGMTPQEVRAVLPQVSDMPSGATLDDGAVAFLTYGGTFARRPAVVQFYFLGGKLDAVMVRLTDVQPGRGSANLEVVRAVRDGPIDQAGAPTYRNEFERDGFTAWNLQWGAPARKISLSYYDLGGRRTSLWLSFHSWAWRRLGPHG